MAIMVVLQLPPMLSSRILVSLLSLRHTRQLYVTGYMHPYVTIRTTALVIQSCWDQDRQPGLSAEAQHKLVWAGGNMLTSWQYINTARPHEQFVAAETCCALQRLAVSMRQIVRLTKANMQQAYL